jgi:hypothetical protein
VWRQTQLTRNYPKYTPQTVITPLACLTACSLASSLADSTTFAPLLADAMAIDLPNPEDAPETSTVADNPPREWAAASHTSTHTCDPNDLVAEMLRH